MATDNLPKREIRLSEHVLLHWLCRETNHNIKQVMRDCIKYYGLDNVVAATPVEHHIILETKDYLCKSSRYGKISMVNRKKGHARPKTKKAGPARPKQLSKEAKLQKLYDEKLERQRQQEHRTVPVYVKKKAWTPKGI